MQMARPGSVLPCVECETLLRAYGQLTGRTTSRDRVLISPPSFLLYTWNLQSPECRSVFSRVSSEKVVVELVDVPLLSDFSE
jgi:hypothetical protein